MFNFLKKYFLVTLFILAPFRIHAAELYFLPSTEKVGPGDSFYVDVMIDVEECINTVSAEIEFPSQYFSLADFFTGESILSLWIEKPETADLERLSRDGILKFSGGIPGGYCGKIVGDPGASNILGRMVFRATANFPEIAIDAPATINFSKNNQIFLNDGFGTLDAVETKSLGLILSAQSVSSSDERQNGIDADNTPPEPFVVELYSTPSVYDGQKYVVFSTVDKQTGIDYYQAMEISPEENAGIKPKRSWIDVLLGKRQSMTTWKSAKTPYLLEDQSLNSVVKVKAVDKAGNERVVDYVPPRKETPVKQGFLVDNIFWIFSLLVIIVILFAIIFFRKKKGEAN